MLLGNLHCASVYDALIADSAPGCHSLMLHVFSSGVLYLCLVIGIMPQLLMGSRPSTIQSCQLG